MDQPPSTPTPPPDTAAPASTSVFAKLGNVIAAPGDVFAEIKVAPVKAINWLLPVLIASVLGVVTSLIIFSQPNIQQQLREQQARGLDQRVKAGKMTQAQEDQALAAMDRFMGPTTLKVFGSIGSFVFSFFRLVWWAFLLWLFARWFLKVPVRYGKTLEIAGLAVVIVVLGGIVTLLLQMNLDRLMVTPSATLLLSEFDMTRKAHWFLALTNPFYFWQLALMALGLAKVAGAPFWRAAVPVLVFWLLQESGLILAGLGQFAM
jgi:Yip1 domain